MNCNQELLLFELIPAKAHFLPISTIINYESLHNYDSIKNERCLKQDTEDSRWFL